MLASYATLSQQRILMSPGRTHGSLCIQGRRCVFSIERGEEAGMREKDNLVARAALAYIRMEAMGCELYALLGYLQWLWRISQMLPA